MIDGRLSQKTLGSVFAISVAFVATILQVAGFGYMPWIILTLFCYSFLLMADNRLLLLVFWCGVSTVAYVQRVFPSHVLNYVDEGMTVLILVQYLGSITILKENYPSIQAVHTGFYGLLGAAVLSYMLHRGPLAYLIRYMFAYYSVFVLFFVSYRNAKKLNVVWVIRFITIFVISQFVLNIGWLLHINPLPNFMLGTVDFAIGSLASSTNVAYLSIFLIYVYVALLCESNSPKKIAYNSVIIVLALSSFYLTSTKHAYPFLLLGVLIVGLMSSKSRKSKITLSFLLIVAPLIFLLFLDHFDVLPSFSSTHDKRGLAELSFENISLRISKMVAGVKGEVFRNVFIHAPKEISGFYLFGAGPGNFASSVGFLNRNYLAEKYVNYFYLTFSGRMELMGGSITQRVQSGFISIVSETGFVGFVFYYGLHVGVALHLWKNVYRRSYCTIEQHALAVAVSLLFGIVLVLSFLTDSFLFDPIVFGMWILAGMLWDDCGALSESFDSDC